jgi:hypothetical protein
MTVSNLQLQIDSEKPATGPLHSDLQNGNILNGRFSRLTEEYFFCQFVAIFARAEGEGLQPCITAPRHRVKTVNEFTEDAT